jgi:hypothetical protein
LSGNDIAEIRSAGDEALFNMPTRDIKDKLGVKIGSLADILPTITLKAKDLATEITTFNTKEKDLRLKNSIKHEHIENNSAVRNLLNRKGIHPERLAAEIDVTRLEKRISEKEILKKKTNDFLTLNELLIDLRGIVDIDELNKIKKTISSNLGNVTLKIIFGKYLNPSLMIRKVTITSNLIKGLSKYLVLE